MIVSGKDLYVLIKSYGADGGEFWGEVLSVKIIDDYFKILYKIEYGTGVGTAPGSHDNATEVSVTQSLKNDTLQINVLKNEFSDYHGNSITKKEYPIESIKVDVK